MPAKGFAGSGCRGLVARIASPSPLPATSSEVKVLIGQSAADRCHARHHPGGQRMRPSSTSMLNSVRSGLRVECLDAIAHRRADMQGRHSQRHGQEVTHRRAPDGRDDPCISMRRLVMMEIEWPPSRLDLESQASKVDGIVEIFDGRQVGPSTASRPARRRRARHVPSRPVPDGVAVARSSKSAVQVISCHPATPF